ncbi:hypothetical protein AB1Y20_014572 [Prymnesium parvum]|uniref:Uncharacterized protein n=1 Tax=Prymnesium parvum TaxID=97485 RepID=A0AB34ICP2_PRYPA
MRASRTHREAVLEKQAEAARPTPVPLTEELLKENTLEDCATVKSVELLFTSFSAMPGLEACAQLQELTIISARLQRVPPELAHVRHSLRRLCLATNEIRLIEHLEGMASLESVQLQENLIARAAGLEGCPALRRLWLSSNKITSLAGLGQLLELRELWLQNNPIETLGNALAPLRNLQVLSLAATRISSLEQLRPIQERHARGRSARAVHAAPRSTHGQSRAQAVPTLLDLAFEDVYFGAAPIVDQPSYAPSALQMLGQERARRPIAVLDGRRIAERERSSAEEHFLQRSIKFAERVDLIKQEGERELHALELQRQESAAELRQMKTSLTKAYTLLKAKVHRRSLHLARRCAQVTARRQVMEGLRMMREEEEAFLQAHERSSAQLREALAELRVQYEEEVRQLAAREAQRQGERERKLARLQQVSEAMSLVGSQLLEAQLASNGRLFAEILPHGDPQLAFVKAKVEAESVVDNDSQERKASDGRGVEGGRGGDGNSGAALSTALEFELICCYRFYHMAPHAATVAAADAAQEEEATPHPHVVSGRWMWCCAPLDQLLQLAVRGSDGGDVSPSLHARLSPAVSIRLAAPPAETPARPAGDSHDAAGPPSERHGRASHERAGAYAALLCQLEEVKSGKKNGKPSTRKRVVGEYLVLYDIIATQEDYKQEDTLSLLDNFASEMLGNCAAAEHSPSRKSTWQQQEQQAAAATIVRENTRAAQQAEQSAGLVAIEARVDAEFRAHQLRLWQLVHPQTANNLEESGRRIADLQARLAETYEQIRYERAEQLSLRTQLEARPVHMPRASCRTDDALVSAMRAARTSIAAAVRVHSSSQSHICTHACIVWYPEACC